MKRSLTFLFFVAFSYVNAYENLKNPANPVQKNTSDTLRCKILYEITQKAERIEIDNLGQVYTFLGSAWTKHDTNGKEIGVFTEYGATADDIWDVSDPQKIMFFQPDFQKGVVLDRTMNADFAFNFNTTNSEANKNENRLIPFVATATDSKLWAIDTYSNKILKLDKNGNNILNNNFLDRNNTLSLDCAQMLEHDNRLYIHQKKLGILTFDAFGMHVKTIEIKDLQYFNIINEQIVAYNLGKIHTFDLETGTLLKTYILPFNTENIQVCFVKGKLAVFNTLQQKIQVFALF
jgi:hypothetical protein